MKRRNRRLSRRVVIGAGGDDDIYGQSCIFGVLVYGVSPFSSILWWSDRRPRSVLISTPSELTPEVTTEDSSSKGRQLLMLFMLCE